MLKLIILSVSIGFLFIHAEPLILLKRVLGFKEEHYDFYGVNKRFIYRLLTCVMCVSFWIGLILSIIFNLSLFDLLLTSTVSSVLGAYIEKKLND